MSIETTSSFAGAETWQVESLLHPYHMWLVILFGVYILAILVFASIYSSLYVKTPNHFVVNSDVLQTRREVRESELIEELATAKTLLPALEQISYSISESEEQLHFEETKLGWDWTAIQDTKAGRVKITKSLITRKAPDTFVGRAFIEVSGKWHKLQTDFYTNPPETISELHRFLQQKLNECRERIDNRGSELMAIQSREGRVLTFADFLYFSVITQTTVGYGDILPNSTTIRTAVVCQVMCGLSILAFLINLVFQL